MITGMTIVRLIVGIAAWVGLVACGITTGLITWSAVDKVNERLPAD
jgi:hypothetical protein